VIRIPGIHTGSSLLRSDGSHDGQAGGWFELTVAKDAQRESWETTLESQETYLTADIVTA
jgi:hypothetical protein